ncbi:MAG: hypothetical protein EOP52_12995 [Sphingobacteriales bacterium]|nr:MAG: hypothetical protein EOP52_12995 [Sphingobacteriales bacterium]
MTKSRLLNDCWYTGIQVFPKNWNTTRASMREHWYLWYRFYDPTFKDEKHKGVKLIIIKAGINDYVDREDRQAAIRTLVDNEVKLIEQLGYNHFTGQYMKVPEPTLYRIEPDTPWTEAIDAVRQYLKLAPSTASDLIYTVRAVQKAAIRLRFETIPVSQVKRLHIKRTLEQVQAVSKNNSNHSYNKHRTHLMILFGQLIEEECCEQNPVASIRKLIVEQKEEGREELTDAQRVAVDAYLGARHPNYQRFFRIFFKSGCRFAEMVKVQGKHVDLEKQEFKVWVRKGKQLKLDTRVIADVVVEEWRKAMAGCGPEQYVFGTNRQDMVPADTPRTPLSLTRFWARNIKHCRELDEFPDMAGITADAYSLKHSNANEVADTAGIALASLAAGHTTTSTTLRYYAKRHQQKVREQEREVLRKVGNTFSSGSNGAA